MNNIRDLQFDIIIVAGQSNAEGNGKKSADDEIISDEIFHLIDSNKIFTRVCDDGSVVIDMVYPTEMIIERAHERLNEKNEKMADFAQTFANEYIKNGKLTKERKILIVKTAVGGTGFARKEWGVVSILYKRFIDMVNYALQLNEDNRIVALLWHQGEHDAFENASLEPIERFEFYRRNFTEQMLDIRKRYGEDIPVVAGEFADSWAELPENKKQCDAVERALKESCAYIGRAAVASSYGLLSNDEVFHDGDNLHFCGESVYELGKRYYTAFAETEKG